MHCWLTPPSLPIQKADQGSPLFVERQTKVLWHFHLMEILIDDSKWILTSFYFKAWNKKSGDWFTFHFEKCFDGVERLSLFLLLVSDCCCYYGRVHISQALRAQSSFVDFWRETLNSGCWTFKTVQMLGSTQHQLLQPPFARSWMGEWFSLNPIHMVLAI